MNETNGRQGIFSGYAPQGVHPLSGYVLLMSIFASLFAGFLALLRLTGRRLPGHISTRDILLLAIGTYKASRLLTKDSVTGSLRAPFTEFEKPTGDGEVDEKPRGKGLRHAVGELVVCPYCAGQWVAALFVYGFVLVPRFTRLVASLMAISAISDYLHLAMDATKRTVMHMPEVG